MLNSPTRRTGAQPQSLMTLPQAAVSRQLKHRRRIDAQVFARGNGPCEVDAVLTDVKRVGLNLLQDFRLVRHRAAVATTLPD
ncbi:MAG: hypothetical protein Q7S91_03095 [Aquabacterium sp.]|nr:hypothetical protein [Aquabacterium sp.]